MPELQPRFARPPQFANGVPGDEVDRRGPLTEEARAGTTPAEVLQELEGTRPRPSEEREKAERPSHLPERGAPRSEEPEFDGWPHPAHRAARTKHAPI